MAHDGDTNSLKSLPKAKLRQIWGDRVGHSGRRGNPPLVRSLLIRELAWQAQQAIQGGLDAQTQALLKAAINRANLQKPGPKKPQSICHLNGRVYPQTPRLQTGTKLVRRWRGKTYEVLVIDNGKRFQFRNETYRSLTPIAMKITGAHWSGPRFFGMNRVRAVR
jgi:hypothetical protein